MGDRRSAEDDDENEGEGEGEGEGEDDWEMGDGIGERDKIFRFAGAILPGQVA